MLRASMTPDPVSPEQRDGMRDGDPYSTGDESVQHLVQWLRTAIQGAKDAGHDTLMLSIPKTAIRVAELVAIADRLEQSTELARLRGELAMFKSGDVVSKAAGDIILAAIKESGDSVIEKVRELNPFIDTLVAERDRLRGELDAMRGEKERVRRLASKALGDVRRIDCMYEGERCDCCDAAEKIAGRALVELDPLVQEMTRTAQRPGDKP